MKNKKEIFITNSFKETQVLGERVVKGLNPFRGLTPKKAIVIALYGNLGSGKTTFVQGTAKGLGIKRRIISPTFIIIRHYDLKSQISNLKSTSKNLKSFYHIDLYRIEGEKDVLGLGIEEIISDPGNIVVIEWAEKMGRFLPQNRIDIKFEYMDEDKRKITIDNF